MSIRETVLLLRLDNALELIRLALVAGDSEKAKQHTEQALDLSTQLLEAAV